MTATTGAQVQAIIEARIAFLALYERRNVERPAEASSFRLRRLEYETLLLMRVPDSGYNLPDWLAMSEAELEREYLRLAQRARDGRS